MSLTSGTRLGSYEILAPLGKGGMGEVYRARDAKLDRDVAIKILPESFARDQERVARFEREAKVLAALNHANIAQIYGLEDGAIVMELVEGLTVADRIRHGAIPLEESLKIASQIADAIEAAHEKGIVHRDLKPANVKVRDDGTVKVLDFGLAAVVQGGTREPGDGSNSPTLTVGATEAGVIMGTAAYMSPEQARGQKVDKRADIWAFGVVLYEMLTGKRLFEGATASDVLAQVLTKEPDLDRTPAKVRRLLQRCFEKDPRQRLRDIGEWRFLLEDAGPSIPPPKRSPVPLGWIGTAVFALIAGAFAFLHFREKPPAAPQPVRFFVNPPEKAGVSFPNLSVSPDGRRIVYGAIQVGIRRIWVHPLDSAEWRPLAGTEESRGSPFWSPDSRFLVFGGQGKLKRIDVSGGPPQTLCDLPGELRGGFWTKDNRIVFGTSSGGLRQVSPLGGAVVPVTNSDRGSHQSPVLLPDGRHFVYLREGSGESSGIYVGSLDAKPEAQGSRRLLADNSFPAYVGDPRGGNGYLLFVRAGTLMAQPFDTKRLELSAEAVPIAERVPNAHGFYSVSPTGALAYTASGFGDRQLNWYDRQGKPDGTAWTPGPYQELNLSPDATRVAVDRVPPAETWVFEFARNASTLLTPSGGTQPMWSPDGARIVYSRPQGLQLALKAASGAGNEDVLLNASHPVVANDWSRDEHFLLYEDRDPKTNWDLWVLPDPAGSPGARKPSVFLNSMFSETDGKFSPDGRFVAYVSDESGRTEVYVSTFPDPKGGRWAISSGGGYQPRWRSDGRELLYFRPDGTLMSVDVTLNPSFKAGAPRALFQAPIIAGGGQTSTHRWDMTPDGKRFLINTVPGDASAPLTVVLNWQAALRK